MAKRTEIVITGDKKAKAKLQKMAVAMVDATREGMNDITLSILNRVKRSFGPGVSRRGQPPGVGTGRLRRAIMRRVTKKGDIVEGLVGVRASVPYGRILEFGGTTSAHQIFPRNKQALSFPVGFGALAATAARGRSKTSLQAGKIARQRRAGDFITVKSVNHPGSKIDERPFLRPALKTEVRVMADRMRKRINTAISGA